MLRGTRIIEGDEAQLFGSVLYNLENAAILENLEHVFVPTIWEPKPFVDKAGPEIIDQMYTFEDKKGRQGCLIPEVTGLIQQYWNEKWSKECGSKRIFYVSRCFRYERPQAGRYREFTQLGVELLNNSAKGREEDKEEAVDILRRVLDGVELDYRLDRSVKRGLTYYTENGFEAVCESLGAQKQVAGGGAYREGVGFAIGVDRVAQALGKKYE